MGPGGLEDVEISITSQIVWDGTPLEINHMSGLPAPGPSLMDERMLDDDPERIADDARMAPMANGSNNGVSHDAFDLLSGDVPQGLFIDSFDIHNPVVQRRLIESNKGTRNPANKPAAETHDFSAEPLPVSAYIRSSENLKNVKDTTETGGCALPRLVEGGARRVSLHLPFPEEGMSALQKTNMDFADALLARPNVDKRLQERGNGSKDGAPLDSAHKPPAADRPHDFTKLPDPDAANSGEDASPLPESESEFPSHPHSPQSPPRSESPFRLFTPHNSPPSRFVSPSRFVYPESPQSHFVSPARSAAPYRLNPSLASSPTRNDSAASFPVAAALFARALSVLMDVEIVLMDPDVESGERDVEMGKEMDVERGVENRGRGRGGAQRSREGEVGGEW